MTRGAGGGLLRHTVSGMFWMAWGSAANAFLKIGVLVALTRLLDPADFGVVNAVLIVIWVAGGFAQLGLGPALVQRPELDARHEYTAFLTSIILGIVVAALVFVGAPTIAAFLRAPESVNVLQALAWFFPIKGLSVASECLLQRELRFRWLANLEVITYGFGYGLVGIALAAAGWGVWALVAAQLAQVTLKTVVLLLTRPPTVRARPSWRALRDLLGFGTHYTGAYTAVLLANYADNLVVVRWLGSEALGFYTRAYQLMAVPTTLLGDVLDNVLFPTLSRVQHDRERLAAAYLRASALIALVMMPAGAVLVVIAPELIRVAFGARWLSVVPLIQMFALAMVLRTNYRMSDSLARAAGVGFGRVWRQAVYAALVFAGALIGQQWGIRWVAAGVVVALFLNYLLMAHLALSVSAVRWRAFWAAHVPGVVCALLAGGFSWAVLGLLRAWQVPLVARFTGSLGLVAAVAALLVWRFPGPLLGPHGAWLLQTLRETLARRFGGSAARSAEA